MKLNPSAASFTPKSAATQTAPPTTASLKKNGRPAPGASDARPQECPQESSGESNTTATSTNNPLKPQGQACKSVLGTAELLEKILLDVPMFQLFVDMRVCKAFRDTIEGSSKLLEHMWLKPVDPAKKTFKLMPAGRQEVDAIRLKRGGRHQVNPILFSTAFLPTLTQEPDMESCQDLLTCKEVNPTDAFANAGVKPGLHLKYNSDFDKGLYGRRRRFSTKSPYERNIQVLNPNGSWRRMLVAQPAVEHFSVMLRTEPMRGKRKFADKRRIFDSPAEVTMGTVWEFLDDRYVPLLETMLEDVACGAAATAIRRAVDEQKSKGSAVAELCDKALFAKKAGSGGETSDSGKKGDENKEGDENKKGD